MTPTRVRYQVLVLACLLAALTYLDRASFGAAGITIVRSLGLSSEADLRSAHLAFALAYGLFEIPTGWWGDRYGPRRGVIPTVLWWSFLTALHPPFGWRGSPPTLARGSALRPLRGPGRGGG